MITVFFGITGLRRKKPMASPLHCTCEQLPTYVRASGKILGQLQPSRTEKESSVHAHHFLIVFTGRSMSDNKPFACYDHIVFLHARHRVGTRLQATHVQLGYYQAPPHTSRLAAIDH